ncbi:hydrogenase maturation nickel metallochaperone HypA [Eubacterium xylanophilum]|uniref:hydrogenase maturation nickel metallochaperone HypA n=1 Tax=Eubacterium xylanophilum TaxID=39497 RepID=UPI00047D9937|nr:hydrogenase maturation nickel metallochaperone HypA [Eubacterium xylanophilum]MCR5797080.1 hydrogenase maturation nickel metallochaperone HypA [Eubacterium sp.]
MHELPITQSICNIAVEKAEEMGANKVCSITIKMGEYCDYVPEIIQEYFNLLSDGTVAENAKIIVENVPATLYCNDCNKPFSGRSYSYRCPNCGGRNTELKTGKEFYIDRMEIEED